MNLLQLFKFNPNHDSQGRFATGGIGNADFNARDRRLIDIKPTRPLAAAPDQLVTIESLIPGAKYIPYSQTPFFKELQAMQGVGTNVNGAKNKIARDKLFAQQPIESLDIDKLTFTQNVVHSEEYEKFDPAHPLHDPIKAANAQPAQVVEYGGEYYLMDGHHRVVSQIAHHDSSKLRSYVLHIPKEKAQKTGTQVPVAKFNPFHDEHGRFTFAAGTAGYFPSAKKADVEAKKTLEDVSAIEPKVSADMQEIAAANGGRLFGYEYRLKSEASLTRKIHDIAKIERRPVKEVAAEINDAIRYTMVFEPETYKKSYAAADAALKDRGYYQIKHKNNWAGTGDANLNILGITNAYKDTQGHKIQVLFHTPESQENKDRNHALYEVSRLLTTSPEMREKLEAMMRENAKRVRMPG